MKHRCLSLDFARLGIVALAVVCATNFLSPPALGQEPADKEKSWPWRVIDPDNSLRANANKVQEALRLGNLASGDEQMLTDYYTLFRLPRWTLPEARNRLAEKPEKPTETSGERVSLRNDLNKAARAPATKASEVLNAVVMDFLNNKLAKQKDIDPVVRVNAMLTIGELAEPGSSGAKPWSQALPVLLQTVKDQNQIEAVKVAALVGVVRHAREGIGDQALEQQVSAAMVGLAATAVPRGRRTDGLCWMRCQAAEVLGLLGSTGNNIVPPALGKMLTDKELPLSQRCLAARALGQLNYSGSAVNGLPYLQAMGQLAAEALDAEKDNPSRRRLMSRVQRILDGLKGTDDNHKGIAVLVTEADAKQFAAGLQKLLEMVLQVLDDRQLDEDGMRARVEQAQEALGKLLKKAPK